MAYPRVLRFGAIRAFVFLAGTAAFLLLPQQSVAVSPASPVARILYTAESHGALFPCASCSGAPQGGLARRISLLRSMLLETPRPLVVAGPNEFYADSPDASPLMAKKLAPVLHGIFSHAPYTAIYISPAAKADMLANGLPLMETAIAPETKPVVAYFRAGSLVAGCVFLPLGEEPNGSPSSGQILAAQQAARYAAVNAALVIGISPWGMHAEKNVAADLAGYFHILLGGGPGLAVSGQPLSPKAPGVLWIRPYRNGAAISGVNIYSLPHSGSPWLDRVHFSAFFAPVESTLPEDETTRKYLLAAPADAE